MYDFYMALPSLGSVPKSAFYVPGYTEALAFFTGTRIVPNAGFLSGKANSYKDFFFQVGFPCYFVPIHRDNDCFGFVLKGTGKKTPRATTCSSFPYPGIEKIREGSVVYLVEGIKDAYLLLRAGKLVVPFLSGVPTRDFLTFLKSKECLILFIPDKDDHQMDHLKSFYKSIDSLNYRDSVIWYSLNELSDLGDFFLPEKRSTAIEETKQIIRSTETWVESKKS